ncbi:MAG: TetR/AcrR family transcriptional regulator [Bifidobacteriaceae bacterium]|jgi:AcrR family transcriptional regulator|nr:TetR/AcrR family transcriptional regulator [Bifidobacteriaceae bacterium]
MPRVTDAHKEARRKQIRSAATRCFSRSGFHGATMDQIIAEAGLSAGAVYQYFPSKRALILDVATTATSAFADLVEQEANREPLDPPAVAVPRLVADIGRFLTEDRSDKARTALQGWAEAVRDPELATAARAVATRLTKLLESWLDRWRQAGMIAPDVDPELSAPVMLSLLLGMLTQRALIEYFRPDAYAVGIAQLIGRGATPPDGQDIQHSQDGP